LSGLNIIDLKMLNIWPKEDLELFMNYEAIWKDGFISEWDYENNQWIRNKNHNADICENFLVALKCIYNLQDITVDFLREVGYLFIN
jgi:hypothetical protein